MSSHPVSLFRQSLGQTLLLTLALMLLGSSLGLIQGLMQPANEWGYRSFDLIRWAMNSLSDSLIASLLALSLPWLLLSWFGEWLYTRALNRQALFRLFWGEFLKFWTPLSLLLLALCCASQWVKYDSGREIPWELALFIPALSLFMALLFVANSALLRRLLLPGIALLAWLLTGDGWTLMGQPVGHGLTLLAGAGLLFWLQRQLAQGLGDLSLAVPGQVDDEYQAMQRSWLFRSLNWIGVHSPLMLSRSQTPLGAWIKLLGGHPYMLYLQLLAAVGLFGFLISLFLGRAALENMPMANTLWIVACLLAWGILLLLPVRLAGQSYWEFFRTRPLPRSWQYGVNWGVQSCFLLGLAGLTNVLLWSLPEIALQLNFASIGTALLFLWLAGELGIGLLLLLLAFGFGYSPTLIPAAAVLLHSTDWPAFALWGTALAFRCWDFWRFQGHFWEPLAQPSQRVLRLLGYYLPPAGMALAVLLLGIYTQPLAGFVALNRGEGKFGVSEDERRLITTKMLEVLYLQAGKRLDPNDSNEWNSSFEEMQLLRGLVQAPHDLQLAQQLAEKLLHTATFQKMGRVVYSDSEKDTYTREYMHYYLAQAEYWLQHSPPQANRAYLQALISEAQGHWVQALNENSQALKQQPVQLNWLMQKGRLEWRLLRYGPARESYKAALKQFPDQSREAWKALQFISIETGELDKALEYSLRYLQASYRRDIEKEDSYDHPVWLMRHFADYQLGLCPRLPALIAHFKQRKIAPGWLYLLEWETDDECFRRAKRLQDPRAFSRGDRGDGLWLMDHGQVMWAAQALTGQDNRGLRAEALWQANQREAALKLAREVAEAWKPESQEFIYYYALRDIGYGYNSDQALVGHRLLLRAGQPQGLDSGYQVLLRSKAPATDWPLVQKAYAKQPAQLAELQTLYQASERLSQAFVQTGMGQIPRSLKKLEIMVFLAKTLPTELQTAELKAAVMVLQKVMVP